MVVGSRTLLIKEEGVS